MIPVYPVQGAFDDSKLAKLNGVISQGLNPYPYKFEKDEDICEILEKFEDFEKNEGLTVRTAGSSTTSASTER